MTSLNEQKDDIINNKENKIDDLTTKIQNLNTKIMEFENDNDKLGRENSTLAMQVEEFKNVTESQDYIELLNE